MRNDLPGTALLRIERGHAEPEELAAITAVLTACAAGRRALALHAEQHGTTPGHRSVRRPGVTHSACWAGCWACR
ncbi:acyl-CoA carboxylase subunit epsilon [Streptomyces sp. NPDC048603]|uniref:acyl-CoA carboxylase subunit epsilon n=1 Tax=Streptomyces sp. NPDC048603 TaxID=3365577 RepID=UPI00370FD604